jgi:hypothetical protein
MSLFRHRGDRVMLLGKIRQVARTDAAAVRMTDLFVSAALRYLDEAQGFQAR